MEAIGASLERSQTPDAGGFFELAPVALKITKQSSIRVP